MNTRWKRAGLLVRLCKDGPGLLRGYSGDPSLLRKGRQELAAPAWWEQFDDPILHEPIAVALRENKDRRIVVALVREFRGLYSIVRTPPFPQVSAGASAGASAAASAPRPGFPPRHPTRPRPTWRTSPPPGNSASGSKTRSSKKAARADLVASEEGKRGVILSLDALVAGDYLNLFDLDRQPEIAQRSVKSGEKAYRIATLSL